MRVKKNKPVLTDRTTWWRSWSLAEKDNITCRERIDEPCEEKRVKGSEEEGKEDRSTGWTFYGRRQRSPFRQMKELRWRRYLGCVWRAKEEERERGRGKRTEERCRMKKKVKSNEESGG